MAVPKKKQELSFRQVSVKITRYCCSNNAKKNSGSYKIDSQSPEILFWIDRHNIEAFFNLLSEQIERCAELCAQFYFDSSKFDFLNEAVNEAEKIAKCHCLKEFELLKSRPIYYTDPHAKLEISSVLRKGLSKQAKKFITAHDAKSKKEKEEAGGVLAKICRLLPTTLKHLISEKSDNAADTIAAIETVFLPLADLVWTTTKDLLDVAVSIENGKTQLLEKHAFHTDAASETYYLYLLFPKV